MSITCLLSVYRLSTTLSTTWLPPVYYLSTTCLPPVYHLSTTCLPPVYHLFITRLSDAREAVRIANCVENVRRLEKYCKITAYFGFKYFRYIMGCCVSSGMTCICIVSVYESVSKYEYLPCRWASLFSLPVLKS